MTTEKIMGKNSDIGVASVLGILIGFCFAIAFGGSLLWWPIIGFVAAGIGYKPLGLANAIRELADDESSIVCEAWHCVKKTIRILTSIAIIVVSSVPLWLLATAVSGNGKKAAWIICGALALGVIASNISDYFRVVSSRRRFRPFKPHTMALTRKIGKKRHDVFEFLDKDHVSKERFVIRTLLYGVQLYAMVNFLVAQLFTLPLILIDAFVTIVLICATTKRLAAMMGAAIGASAGIATAMVLQAPPPAYLAVGLAIGFCSGPLLYKARERLESMVVRLFPVT